VQVHFELDNQSSGMVQTVYTLAYMGFAPLFGYLGDRYSRKGNIAFGLGVWGVATLLGSFTGVCFLYMYKACLYLQMVIFFIFFIFFL
jgi:MFS family permease